MRTICLTIVFGALGWPTCWATTLQQLSLAGMISKSTAIVHAKATSSYTAFRGSDIYTYYQFQVSQTFKPAGAALQGLQVAVPGGVAQGVRQTVPGAPNISIGVDYVLFLWTSPSGLTQVIGLSQGLFRMTSDPAGNAIIVRPASTEPMIGANGNAVTDQAMVFRWSDVLLQIQKAVGTGN